MRRSGSLGWRILFWIAIIACGTLLIMAYQGYHSARQAIIASKEEHLRSVLQSRKSRIETWLTELKAELRFLAVTPCAHSDCAIQTNDTYQALTSECCNLLEHVHEGSSLYESIAIYDQNWDQILRTTGSNFEGIESIPPVFKAAMDSAEDFLIGPSVLREHGEVTMYIGHPITELDGAKTANIVASLNLSKTLAPILRDRTGLGETGKVYLLSSEGRFLASPTPSTDLIGQAGTTPSGLLITTTSTVHEYDDYRGTKVLGVSASFPVLNWIVVAEIDQKEAFAWLSLLRTRAIITGGIMLAIVLLLATRSATTLSQPLRELAAVSRRVAHGHHEERVGHLDGTEAQEVGRAFNRMLDELAISQRKLIQAASLAAVGELSSSIVHEIRNPLSSIKMNLQALRLKVEEDPVYAELAEIASNQVIRLETMLSDLLNYGKPLQLKLTEISFAELAKDTVEVVRTEAEEKHVSVATEDGFGSTMIIADRDQLWRALTNLVLNAVQASPPYETVLISSTLSSEEPQSALITVSDHGPGITDSQKDKLFQPFFTTREDGTGLGLANVKKIVEYHGGTVSARNQPEGGAAFTIILPLRGPSL